MSEKFEPCPFCGSTDVFTADRAEYALVVCNACGAAGPGADHRSEVTVWNQRAQYKWQPIQSRRGDDLPKDREFLVRRKTNGGTYVIALQRWCLANNDWLSVRPQESNAEPGYADLGEPWGAPEYTEWCEVPS